MSRFIHCQTALAQGNFEEALQALINSPELKQDAKYKFYLLMCNNSMQPEEWELVFATLRPTDQECLYASKKLAKIYRNIRNYQAERKWLKTASRIASDLGDKQQAIELMAAYGNRLLNDGLKVEGITTLQNAWRQAIECKEDNLIVALGVVLGGLLMGDGNWHQASAVATAVEEAAKNRHNMIGYACGRMMRSGCRFNLGQHVEAVRLLFEAGNDLIGVGAISALNCIKARLMELKLQLGEQRFESICKSLM